jgi:hypothetical protein
MLEMLKMIFYHLTIRNKHDEDRERKKLLYNKGQLIILNNLKRSIPLNQHKKCHNHL